MQSTIQALEFHGALLKGAHMVERKRDELNRINGFPVPDRDTGNNLAYLMQQLRRQLPAPKSFEELFQKLSEASLMGARGNSGAIFSQYFSGFREAAAGLHQSIMDHLPLQALASLFKQGYESAFRSIQNPREGTILSAMRSFGDTFQKQILEGIDLKRTAEQALLTLKNTVRESINILPQQRALHAPDAGAMAFLYFTEGFMHSLLGQAETEEEDAIEFALPVMEDTAHPDLLSSKFRYCTEVMLTLREDADIGDTQREILAKMGDSLVVSRAGALARVHLHTNEPTQVVDMLETLGTLKEVKADDMAMQQALAISHPGKTALVVDSIADIPEDLLGPHVYLLPMNLLAEGVSYQDKRTISFDRVRRLAGKLTSSQLNLEEIKQFMDPIMKSYDEALVLTVSSKMSGIHDRFAEYMAQNRNLKIRLVDTKTNSGAEGLLALFALRMLRDGAGLDETADELERIRSRARIFVSLPNLKAMVASGRLNKRVGGVLQAIGFLPLVTINPEGEGTVTGLSFSRSRSDKLLIDKLEPGKIQEYAIVHVSDKPRAEAAAKAIQERIGIPPAYICEISSVVANFSGETSYAVAFIERETTKGGAA